MVIKVLYFKRKVFYYMRLRNIPGAEDAISSSEYCIKNPEEHRRICLNEVSIFFNDLTSIVRFVVLFMNDYSFLNPLLMSLPSRPATFPAVAPALLPPRAPAVFTFRL